MVRNLPRAEAKEFIWNITGVVFGVPALLIWAKYFTNDAETVKQFVEYNYTLRLLVAVLVLDKVSELFFDWTRLIGSDFEECAEPAATQPKWKLGIDIAQSVVLHVSIASTIAVAAAYYSTRQVAIVELVHDSLLPFVPLIVLGAVILALARRRPL